MANTKRSVILKNYNNNFEEMTPHESIYPGMLCMMNSDGEIAKHTGAGTSCLPIMVPIENALEGEDINTALTTADKARVWFPVSGDEVNMLLADGQQITKGDKLESNGDGYLRAYSPLNSEAGGHEDSFVGTALETLDLGSAGVGDDVSECRIAVRIR